MAINFGLLNTQAPAEIGASIGNALAVRRQRDMQDQQFAQQQEQGQVQNALARMQMQQAQRAIDTEDRLRQAYASSGGDIAAAVPKVMAIDPKQGLALSKQVQEVQQAGAKRSLEMTDLAHKKLELYRQGLNEVRTPQDYANWLSQQHNDPDLQPLMKSLPPLEQSLATIPQDQAGFEKMKIQSALGLAKVLELNKPPTPTELSRLIAERDALPQGDPRRATYDAAINKSTTHSPGTTVSFGAPVAALDANGNPVFIQPSKSGGAPSVIPGVRPPENGRAPTEAESKAAFYAGNMRAASKVLDQLESQGLNMSQLGSQLDTAVAGGLGNFVASPIAQQARQAQNQWSEQLLRMLTGAAAPKEEVARNTATYFPQPGDSKQVVAQKRAMRAQAEQGVFSASGKASSRVPAQSDVPAQPAGSAKFLGFEQ